VLKRFIRPSAFALVAAGGLWLASMLQDEFVTPGVDEAMALFMMIDGAPPPSFRAVYSDAANQTTYSFIASDLGTPDPTRMVVVVVHGRGSQNASSVTVDGTGATSVTSANIDTTRFSIWSAASTANATGTISVTFAGSMLSCVIAVYALYPNSQTPVDGVGGTGAATTVTVSNVAKTNGGFTVWGAGRNSTHTAVVTQNGAETCVEDYDAVVESHMSVFGHHVNTATTTDDDYTVTFSAGSLNSSFVAASWF
jgi:hypothetical protein